MRSFLVLTMFFSYFGTPCLGASASDSDCPSRIARYLSFLLQDKETMVEPPNLSDSRISKILQITRVPGKIINDRVDQATEWVTEKTLNKPMVIRPLPKAIGGGLIVGTALDAGLDHISENEVKKQIEAHAEEYDRLIRSDIRYAEIQDALTNKKISPQEAQQFAYKIRKALHLAVASPEGSPLFSDLNSEIKKGGIRAEALIANRQLMWITLDLLPDLTRSTPKLAEIRKDPSYDEIIKSITEDPFTKRLRDLQAKGKISEEQLLHSLGEDIYWKSRFKEWELLGKRPVSEKNKAARLTLNDTRNEILKRLGASE